MSLTSSAMFPLCGFLCASGFHASNVPLAAPSHVPLVVTESADRPGSILAPSGTDVSTSLYPHSGSDVMSQYFPSGREPCSGQSLFAVPPSPAAATPTSSIAPAYAIPASQAAQHVLHALQPVQPVLNSATTGVIASGFAGWRRSIAPRFPEEAVAGDEGLNEAIAMKSAPTSSLPSTGVAANAKDVGNGPPTTTATTSISISSAYIANNSSRIGALGVLTSSTTSYAGAAGAMAEVSQDPVVVASQFRAKASSAHAATDTTSLVTSAPAIAVASASSTSSPPPPGAALVADPEIVSQFRQEVSTTAARVSVASGAPPESGQGKGAVGLLSTQDSTITQTLPPTGTANTASAIAQLVSDMHPTTTSTVSPTSTFRDASLGVSPLPGPDSISVVTFSTNAAGRPIAIPLKSTSGASTDAYVTVSLVSNKNGATLAAVSGSYYPFLIPTATQGVKEGMYKVFTTDASGRASTMTVAGSQLTPMSSPASDAGGQGSWIAQGFGVTASSSGSGSSSSSSSNSTGTPTRPASSVAITGGGPSSATSAVTAGGSRDVELGWRWRWMFGMVVWQMADFLR